MALLHAAKSLVVGPLQRATGLTGVFSTLNVLKSASTLSEPMEVRTLPDTLGVEEAMSACCRLLSQVGFRVL